MLHGRFFRRIAELKSQVDRAPALPFSGLLCEQRIQDVLVELKVFYRDRVYPPCVTLWVFLSQVLSEDQSCRNAVARLLAFRTAQRLGACSTDTGSYCEARGRLPEELIRRLARQTGKEIHDQAPSAWRVRGRPVKLVDGTTVSMPDTAANTAAFDKPRNQRGPSGFPVARLVAVLCLATGAALDAAIGPCRGKKTGELSLFRGLHNPFAPDDIVLADRLYCTYCDIARLKGQGVDVVFRMSAKRKTDFRRGRQLGPKDHLIVWNKPLRCPDGISPQEFATLPGELCVRELRVAVTIPGFRVRSIVVATTLTDPEAFSKRDVADLFRQRWHAELDLRSIKTVMHMDVLRCKTPEMVRKEIWLHLLAYNLLRSVMCAAADESEMKVRELSFKGTLQIFNAFYHMIVTAGPADLEALCTRLMRAVREHRVGDRPDRFEPRKIKRPAKPYPQLKRSRSEERKLCA
jgi:hypothetical protein